MPIVVNVVSQEDYEAWAGEQKTALAALPDDPNKEWTKDELVARGNTVFTANCVACHQPTGKALPGPYPALDGDAKSVLGPMKDQILTRLNGHPSTAMAAVRHPLNDCAITPALTHPSNP